MATVVRKCGCDTAKCGHPWTVRYREPGGRTARQRERSFPRKREADAFAAKVENNKNEGVYLDPARGAMTVHAWSDQWLADQILAPGTRRDYRGFIKNYVVPELGRKTLIGVTTSDIQSLIATMHRNGLAPSTIRARLIPLRAMFSAAVRDKRIPSNPCEGVSVPREASQQLDRDAVPTLATVTALAAEMTPRLRLSIWLMTGLGLRISETMAVTEDCLRGDVFRIWQQTSSNNADGSQRTALTPLKHRAAGECREIPLPSFLADEVREHIDTYGSVMIDSQPGILFPSTGGAVPGRHIGAGPRFSTHSTYRYHWMKTLKALNLVNGNAPLYTPHDLRHFFASAALAGGVSLLEVSHWLGHRSITVTADIYGHLTEDAPDRMRRVMQDALRPPLRVVHSA
jgi:integrase